MAREIIPKIIGPNARGVGLQFEIEIVNVPKLKTVNKSGFFIADVKNVIIAGKVIKVNILRDPGHELLGILFEDSSKK